jgi:acyl-coenzyme A thioesterase PaaI-like protein
VLTVELKVNLLEPADGQRVLARGRVLRSGRTLTVCKGEAVTVKRTPSEQKQPSICSCRGPGEPSGRSA